MPLHHARQQPRQYRGVQSDDMPPCCARRPRSHLLDRADAMGLFVYHPQGDRFIPTRSGLDLSLAHFNLTGENRAPPCLNGATPHLEVASPSKEAYKRQLAQRLLRGGDGEQKILAFCAKAPEAAQVRDAHLRELFSSNAGSNDRHAKRHFRHIPASPERILVSAHLQVHSTLSLSLSLRRPPPSSVCKMSPSARLSWRRHMPSLLSPLTHSEPDQRRGERNGHELLWHHSTLHARGVCLRLAYKSPCPRPRTRRTSSTTIT
jgi:hypothetical protein